MQGDPILEPLPLSSYEEYLVSLWREAGTVSQKGMGIDALDWTELIAWSERFYSDTLIEWVRNPDNKRHKPVPLLIKYCTLPDVDLQIIRQMSQEYCWMSQEATDPRCACPIDVEELEMSEEQEDDAVEDVLASLRAMGFLGEDGQSL